jgi:hypothetical protein
LCVAGLVLAAVLAAGHLAAAPVPDLFGPPTFESDSIARASAHADSLRAVAAAADSARLGLTPAGAAADSAGTARARALLRASTAREATRRKRSLADTTRVEHLIWHEQPRWVMARSLVIPGWGQLHNHAWFKAVAVAGAESYLAVHMLKDNTDLKDLNLAVDAARATGDFDSEAAAVDRYNAVLDRFVRRQWLLAGLVTYALMDAYVDAHFVKFKLEFEHDPALPEGVSGAKVSLEKKF